jgi:tetratricopeptide (TPR) repeat protein
MSVRNVFLASVCAAFLAASAAVSGSAAATENSNEALAKEAYKALAAGDAKAAIAGYTQAIDSRELEPEVLANALLNRALAYQNQGEHPLAIDDYTAALRLDAMSGKLRAMALYNRALSYQKVQRPALAMEDYTGALFLDSGFAHAYYGRGNLLRDSGQYLFALADYDKALQHKFPQAAKVHYNQALTFEALQRPDNVRQALTLALAADSNYTPARQKLAALDSGAPILAAMAKPKLQGGTLVARKQELPDAQAPSATLLPDQPSAEIATASVTAPEKPVKKIVDRVAPSEVETASIAKPVEEKIIAVEPVTEEAAAEEPAVEATAEAETEAQPVQKGWSVQIASAASEDAAWSTFKKMQQRYKVLRDKEPVVIKADLGTKGTFYRVRLVGFEAQTAAKSACSKLKSGGVKCYVSKADG